MEKLWIIIKREYVSRVMKKSFLLVTILAPLSIALIALIGGFFASKGASETKVAYYDPEGLLDTYTLPSNSIKYTKVSGDFSRLKESYHTDGYQVLIEVPGLDSMGQSKVKLDYYSAAKLSISTISQIESTIRNGIEAHKLANSGIDQSALDKLKVSVNMENGLAGSDEGDGDKSSKLSSMIATALAYIMGFLMYMVIFIFGTMVMRSVMEEKINRIVEVMISSVRPFQLLLGKVLGVGMVGITQLLIWIILIPLVMYVVTQFMGGDAAAMSNGAQAAQAKEVLEQINQESGSEILNIIKEIRGLNWWTILPSFIIFFFGGYFLYSSLFAAVGASIGDDLQEGQQMMLPIIVPVIIAFIMMPSILQDPNGKIAVFGSIFPLFSPILMPARLPFEPPLWQVLISLVVLVLTVILFTWLAARIYRVGIFMYGKKVSFRELGKWLFYKP